MNDFYRGKRVLIIGGLGFIGSNLTIRAAQSEAHVTVVDSMIPEYGARLANIEPVKDQIKINFSDIRDPYSLSYLVRGQQVVFSLAGQVSHLRSMQDPQTDLEINCRSQLSLLECCRQNNPEGKIVLASTRQIYGRPKYLPVDEAHPLIPVDVNGVNKLAAEMYYNVYHHAYQMRTVSLRLTNTYGPRMDLVNLQKGFVGVFVAKALAGDDIELFGTGQQRRDFNYVDDVVDALLLAGASSEVDGHSFNLGHERHYSLLEFVQTLRQFAEFEYRCVPFPADRQAIDVGDYYGDYQRFHQVTGWRPRVDLDEGLRRTLEFFRDDGDTR